MIQTLKKKACWFVVLSWLNTKFSSYYYYNFMWNVKYKKKKRQIPPLKPRHVNLCSSPCKSCYLTTSYPPTVNWLRHILLLLTEYVISSSTVYWLRHFLLLFHRPDSPSNRKSPLLIGWLFFLIFSSNSFTTWQQSPFKTSSHPLHLTYVHASSMVLIVVWSFYTLFG